MDFTCGKDQKAISSNLFISQKDKRKLLSKTKPRYLFERKILDSNIVIDRNNFQLFTIVFWCTTIYFFYYLLYYYQHLLQVLFNFFPEELFVPQLEQANRHKNMSLGPTTFFLEQNLEYSPTSRTIVHWAKKLRNFVCLFAKAQIV